MFAIASHYHICSTAHHPDGDASCDEYGGSGMRKGLLHLVAGIIGWIDEGLQMKVSGHVS